MPGTDVDAKRGVKIFVPGRRTTSSGRFPPIVRVLGLYDPRIFYSDQLSLESNPANPSNLVATRAEVPAILGALLEQSGDFVALDAANHCPLPHLFIKWESIKGALIEMLPPHVLMRATFGHWYMRLIPVSFTCDPPRLILHCANGTVVEMVRHDLTVVEQVEDDLILSPIENLLAKQEITGTAKGSAISKYEWIPFKHSVQGLISFKDKLFVPYRVLFPEWILEAQENDEELSSPAEDAKTAPFVPKLVSLYGHYLALFAPKRIELHHLRHGKLVGMANVSQPDNGIVVPTHLRVYSESSDEIRVIAFHTIEGQNSWLSLYSMPRKPESKGGLNRIVTVSCSSQQCIALIPPLPPQLHAAISNSSSLALQENKSGSTSSIGNESNEVIQKMKEPISKLKSMFSKGSKGENAEGGSQGNLQQKPQTESSKSAAGPVDLSTAIVVVTQSHIELRDPDTLEVKAKLNPSSNTTRANTTAAVVSDGDVGGTLLRTFKTKMRAMRGDRNTKDGSGGSGDDLRRQIIKAAVNLQTRSVCVLTKDGLATVPSLDPDFAAPSASFLELDLPSKQNAKNFAIVGGYLLSHESFGRLHSVTYLRNLAPTSDLFSIGVQDFKSVPIPSLPPRPVRLVNITERKDRRRSSGNTALVRWINHLSLGGNANKNSGSEQAPNQTAQDSVSQAYSESLQMLDSLFLPDSRTGEKVLAGGSENVFSKLSEGLSERGERLEILQNKLSVLAENSKRMSQAAKRLSARK